MSYKGHNEVVTRLRKLKLKEDLKKSEAIGGGPRQGRGTQ